MNHPLQCRCGTLRGYVSHPRSVNRAVCYCRDCQAFAHFLGPAGETLDVRGGTDVIQTLPAHVALTQGLESLACMRLSPKGLLRWYTTCCNTAVGNTLDNYRVSFVGLVHTCLEGAGKSLDDSFGPVRMHVNTKSAKGMVKSGSIATMAGILRFIAMVTRARVDGSYKRSPFFSIPEGTPVVTPRVLSRDEREKLMKAVHGG